MFGFALWIWGHNMVCHAQCSPFRSYLFFLSALCFLWPVGPTPVPLAPTGPAQAPFPPHLMGGPPHPPLRATHRDAFVSCILKKEAMVRLCSMLLVAQPQNIIPLAVSFSSCSPLHTEQECNRNGSNFLPQSWDKKYFSDC